MLENYLPLAVGKIIMSFSLSLCPSVVYLYEVGKLSESLANLTTIWVAFNFPKSLTPSVQSQFPSESILTCISLFSYLP